MAGKAHWERVFTTRSERDVSWFEAEPSVSLALLEAAGMTPASCVVDVGGGDWRLVDALLARGLLRDGAGCLRRRITAGAHEVGEQGAVPVWILAHVTPCGLAWRVHALR